MLDLVSCWPGMYMLDLRLFCSENEALKMAGKIGKHKGSAAEIFCRKP